MGFSKMGLSPCCKDGMKLLEGGFSPGTFFVRIFTGAAKECFATLIAEIMKEAMNNFFMDWLRSKLKSAIGPMMLSLTATFTPAVVGKVGGIVYRMLPCAMYGLKIMFKTCLRELFGWMGDGID